MRPILLGVVDDRSRLASHANGSRMRARQAWCMAWVRASPNAACRALLTDNGSAMIAEDFTAGLHALGILSRAAKKALEADGES